MISPSVTASATPPLFTSTPSGAIEYTADGQSYKFKTDGKDYLTPQGQTAAWKRIDSSTVETTYKLNGKVIGTETTKFAGDTLTVHSKGPKPGGGNYDDTAVYQRVSGGPGMYGKWKTKNFTSSAPSVMELTASGDDGLTVKIPDFQITSEAKFDGKDYPFGGPTVAAGFTIALKKSGPRGFEMTEKQNGKPLYQVTMTVSDDGKTLIETGGAVGVNEKIKAVYDRQ